MKNLFATILLMTPCLGQSFHCPHPDQKQILSFRESPLFEAIPNTENVQRRYQFKLRKFSNAALCYVEWDPNDLDTIAPYETHLKEILEDLKKINPNEILEGDPYYELSPRGGFGIARTSSHLLYSVQVEDLLVGFAIQNHPFMYSDFEIGDLLERVSCLKENALFSIQNLGGN